MSDPERKRFAWYAEPGARPWQHAATRLRGYIEVDHDKDTGLPLLRIWVGDDQFSGTLDYRTLFALLGTLAESEIERRAARGGPPL